ncbi:hypothetical protein [Saccharothrix obliqua]|uniref:hypothetical protein n=1 Tax=Saccharothrix obliqua TaxID=2861747 RepID=UPI001C5F0C32|nr:hypothetical protein [Saccharothrix obliqua]MBW4717006.1 hypothetical protein [Saccharothrix obliqua]
MTTDPETPTWGEAQEAPETDKNNRWSKRKTLAAIAVAVGIAAVGGGVIYAAGNSDAAQMGMTGPRGGGGMMIMGPGPFGDTAHGQFQNGEITEVTDSSITLKSTDGYTRTYQVNSKTTGLGSVAKGDSVMLVANNEGVATSVIKGGSRPGGAGQGRGDTDQNREGSGQGRGDAGQNREGAGQGREEVDQDREGAGQGQDREGASQGRGDADQDRGNR